MDISKLLTLLCAILLMITLLLSVTSVFMLKEISQWNAGSYVKNEDENDSTEVTDNTESNEEETMVNSTENEVPPSIDADILYNQFYICEVNGKIGIFCDEGQQLIRMLNVNVATLPQSDREKLKKGIRVNSWNELVLLIQDYE